MENTINLKSNNNQQHKRNSNKLKQIPWICQTMHMASESSSVATFVQNIQQTILIKHYANSRSTNG